MEHGKHKGTNPFIATITRSTTSVLSGLFHFFPRNPTMANAGSCMNIDSMDVSYPIHNRHFIHSYVTALIFNFIKD
jgi:hypothetical protein